MQALSFRSFVKRPPRRRMAAAIAGATALVLLLGATPIRSQADQIGVGDFGPDTQTTTFDDLGLPFINDDPLVIDGHTITTNDGIFRYWAFDIVPCQSNDCISTNSELGFIDIVLDEPAVRAGAYASGVFMGYTVRADFFDASDTLLGSVVLNNPDDGEPLFAGWEDENGIARIRFIDASFNGRLMHVDELMVEVPELIGAYISFGRQAAQPDTEMLDGTSVTINDVVDVDTGELVFSRLTELGLLGDLDAFHMLDNGNVLYSTEPYVFNVPDVGTVHPGDVIEYDPDTDTFSLFFNNNEFVGLGNVDAVSIAPSGNLLLSTKGPGELPGVGPFQDGDVIEWDGETGHIFLAEGDIFTSGANNDVDAVHSEDGAIVISPRTDGQGGLGSNGFHYGFDQSDLFRIDLATGEASRLFDGENFWDSGNTRQTDAAFLPPEATCPCWDAHFLMTEVMDPSPCGTTANMTSASTLARGTDADGCSGLARASIRFELDGSATGGICISNNFEFVPEAGRCLRTDPVLSPLTAEEFDACAALVDAHCP